MPIYTKKGDKGETSLISKNKNVKRRVRKDSLRVTTIGAIDELNSYLGVTLSYCDNPEIANFVREIQRNLFTINSILAGAKLSFTPSKTKKLERKIDEIDKIIPPIQNFIIVSGVSSAVHFQYSRALARRAERRLVALNNAEKAHPEAMKYLNRLSDTLFTLARYINFQSGIVEESWKGK